MTETEMKKLSDSELKELSLQKNKKGNATSDASKAQMILWRRAGNPFCGGGGNVNYLFEDDENNFDYEDSRI